MTVEKILKSCPVAEAFIKMITNHLKEYNGKITFKMPQISSREIDGEFSEFNMTIKCYLDCSSNYWIGVLAHEYAHFLQCISGSEYWTNFQNEVASIQNIDTIFKNKKSKVRINKPKRLRLVSHIVKMELDCDKAAIRLINKWKLPVDKKEYVCKANIVLYKYLYWGEYGAWPSITDKNTNKTTDWRILKFYSLMNEEKYRTPDDIPRKLFYIFQDNES